GPKMMSALRTARIDYDNAQTAWIWAVQHAQIAQLWDMFLILAYGCYWLQNRLQEAQFVISPAVAKLQNSPAKFQDNELLGSLLGWQSVLFSVSDSPEKSEEYAEKSLMLLDRLDISGVRPETPLTLSLVGFFIGIAGNIVQAEKIFDRAVAMCHQGNYRFELGFTLGNRAEYAINIGLEG